MSSVTHNPQIKPQRIPLTLSTTELPLARLILIGLATQIIYVTYIVAFPLISNTQAGGPAADLEILMRTYRWFAPIYTLGVLLLYYLFWQALQHVSEPKLPYGRFAFPGASPAESRFSLNTLKILVLTFGLLFGFTLVWLYPITANDLFRYVLRGRIWAVYGESPMLAPPNNFPNDPYIAFAGEFGQWVSGYGPLWEIIVQIPLHLGAVDMVPGSVSLKLIVLLSYLLCAILIGWFAVPEAGSSLTALTFFAWNPLILIQGPGNGHNDLVFMALMVGGIVLWQRRVWWAATLVLTLAFLAKISALLLLPLFAVVFLKNEPTWRQRLLKGMGAALIVLATSYLVYSALGPLSDIFRDVWLVLTKRLGFVLNASATFNTLWTTLGTQLGFIGAATETPPGLGSMLTARRGFAIASGLRMLLREIIPRQVAEVLPRTTASYIFLIFYTWLLVQLWRNKLNLITAGFLAYFSQLMLGSTFRIWYPMWLIPLAALHLTPATFWPTFLFSLTAELSIINYFVVWRWWLDDWAWGKSGPLSQYWNYWTIMHLLTVPWLFGIPLFGPIMLRWWERRQARHPTNPIPSSGTH